MRRILIGLTCLSGVALSAPAVNDVAVSISYGSISVYVNGSGSAGGSIGANYGTTTSLGYAPFERIVSAWGYLTHTYPIGGLTPNTTYYLQPLVHADGDYAVWNCNTQGAPVGTTCHAGTGLLMFTTLPAPAETALYPTAPTITAPTAPPAETLSVINVSTVSELASAITTCAANTSGTQAIAVALGTYVTNIELPTVGGTANCIIRNADTTKIPPAGVRIGPQWKANLPRLVLPISTNGNWSTGDYITSTVFYSTGGIRGWYIYGLLFGTEDQVAANPKIYNITEFTGNKILKVVDPATSTEYTYGTVPAELGFKRSVQIWGVTGTWPDPPNGSGYVIETTGGGRLSVNGPQAYDQTGEAYLTWYGGTGTYSGGGKIRAAVASGVCAASNATPIRITTCREHGLSNRTAQSIASISGAQITMPYAYHRVGQWEGSDYIVRITGSSVTAYNGYWSMERYTASNGGTTFNLQAYPGGASVPASSCSSSCGTIQLLEPVSVQGVAGNTATNGVWLMSVVDDTHIDLLGSVGNGAYTSGGILAQETFHHWGYLSFVSGSEVSIDRCYFEGGFPNRIQQAVSYDTSNSSLINSYFDDIQWYRLVNPLTHARVLPGGMDGQGLANEWYHSTVVVLNKNVGSNVRIENNYFEGHGTTFFFPDSNSSGPNNILLRRNSFFANIDTKIAGLGSNSYSGFKGPMYFPHRHHWELKNGQVMKVSGNIFDGAWIDYNGYGPITMITPRSYFACITDINLESNTYRNFPEGFYTTGMDDYDTYGCLTSRIRFANSIFTKMNGDLVSNPHDDPVTPQHPSHPWRFFTGGESYIIEHNAVDLPETGVITKVLEIQLGRLSGMLFRDNIFTWSPPQADTPLATYYWHNNGGSYGSGLRLGVPDVPNTSDQLASFHDLFGSTSKFSNNLILPGLRTAGADMDSTQNGSLGNATRSYNECMYQDLPFVEGFAETTFNWKGFKGIHCAGNGSTGDSVNQRLARIKWMNRTAGDFTLRHDSEYLGNRSRSVTVSSINTSAVITLPANHQILTGYSVTLTGPLAGTYTVATASATTITLTGVSSASTCSSSCGTITSRDLDMTSDGRDPGPDMTKLRSERGDVRNARVVQSSITTTAATIAYTAPDSVACTVEYGTSANWGTGTRVSDGGGAPNRTVALTSLTTGTAYNARILCAVQQPVVTFTTL